jgi:iron complex outermembrane receptor protein
MRTKLSLLCVRLTCDQRHLLPTPRRKNNSSGFDQERDSRRCENLALRKGKSVAVAAAAISFCLLVSAIAQNEFPAVVVVGQPAEISPDLATQQSLLSRYAGAATIVEPGDFNLSRGSYLSDYIRFVPGVLITSAQGSEDSQISIRGSGNLENDTIAGTELVVDGIPINQADGEAYLQDLDLNSVKFAEVYRGADAFRFGGVTLGGSINFITYTGRDLPSPFNIRLSGGSFGLTEQSFQAGWASGPWDFYVSGIDHTLEGFRDWSQEDYQKLAASIGYRFNDSIQNRFYLFLGRLDQNNPSSLTKEEMNANPQQTEPESVQEKWNTYWAYLRLMDRFLIQGPDWTLQIGAYWNYRQSQERQEFDEDAPLGTQKFWSDDFGGDIVFTANGDLLNQHNRFTAGFVPTVEFESDSWYANTDGSNGPLLEADWTAATNFTLYAENQHYVWGRLSILTGLQAVAVGRKFVSPQMGNHDEKFYALNPKLGVAYEWADHNIAYLNFSRSFQPPSFDESLAVTDTGQMFNSLEAQKAWTIEIGSRGDLGPLRWDLAFYHSWLRDELLNLDNAQGVPLGTVNAPRTMHQGVEAEVETHFTSKLKLSQAFVWNNFQFVHNAAYGTKTIAGQPIYLYKAELRYELTNGLYVAPNVEWNMANYPVDEANTLWADPYYVLGVRAGYKSPKGFEVFLEAKNLTNKTYAASVEAIADARQSTDNDSFNPANGRAFYGGIGWSW